MFHRGNCITVLLILGVLLVLAAFAVTSYGATIYPSVVDLERDLKLAKNTQLPRDVQGPDGRIFHAYYVDGKELGNGYYSAIIKLGK